jgi:maltose alpha-D-glucosyltransferase/alpha-amylase
VNVLPKIASEVAVAGDSLWFKDAIIYQLHVKAFADSSGDGIGDFNGLTGKLDYLQDLGVTALWLLPFYPSPGRDDGYDISDYRRVNPDFGSMQDFRRFMQEAKRRNLKIITELVINHTSDQHPWFQRARACKPGSDSRNWYVWSETDQRYAGTRIIFSDTEKSNWTWDQRAQAYYWHRFFAHQPDLNFDNPRVLASILRAMRHWVDLGVDGLRLDAIPYLCEREGTNNENLPETHAIIRKIRAELDAYMPDKVLLAEANQWPEDVSAYFGAGDECHMAYHFPLMPRIYMAIAQEDRFPIADILRQTPEIPENCQWALFLRNHDELTLEMVTDVERDYLWTTYATDPRARINLGIRRRLAPLMNNDRRKIELMNALLMSFPGTPIIYYGDEIGMGDNIYLGDRNGVRTPMQWTPDRNGGFSRADPARLYLPTIMDPVYGYEAVNVEAQSRSLGSLLSWTKRLISVRKSTQCFGRGSLTFIRPANRAVLVYVRQYRGEVIICVANMSRSAQAAEIDLSRWQGHVPREMLGQTNFPPIGEQPYVITLAPYGFFWFQLAEPRGQPADVSSTSMEFATLVITADWMIAGNSRNVLEEEVLPGFLAGRRWFAERGNANVTARLVSAVLLGPPEQNLVLAMITAQGRGEGAYYMLPLMIRWSRFDAAQRDPHALAAVRRGPREGTLVDATGEPAFIHHILSGLAEGTTIDTEHGRLSFRPTGRFRLSAELDRAEMRTVNAEQSNTTTLVGSDYVVKLLRRLEPGLNPEIEIGRFLTEVAPFANTPPLLGSVELERHGMVSAIAVVHQLVENQGDAWTVTGLSLDRLIDEQRLLHYAGNGPSDEEVAYLRRMQQIGQRVAEMQLTLSSRNDLPDFAPEPIADEDLRRWREGVLARADRVCAELTRRRGELPEHEARLSEDLLACCGRLPERLAALVPAGVAAMKIRHHGDFHLGQMLIVKDDVFIIDFEGEPRRTLDERRLKAPAARDIAGLLRSIDYAATAALGRALKLDPDDRSQIAGALDDWREHAAGAFLHAYRQSLGADSQLWPTDQEASDRLLDFFLLEKAVYEIEYELAHRPDWLTVPLAGTLRILARSPS